MKEVPQATATNTDMSYRPRVKPDVLRNANARLLTTSTGEPEEVDEDNMEEIDMDNIVSSRTRGKNIDFAEAAKNVQEDDDDDEDDEDFQDDDAMVGVP